MKLLVTAGNTQTLIDKVRCITNIFTGKTGTALALHAWSRGHQVRLVTSHPEVVAELARADSGFPDTRWHVETYRTFDDLRQLLEHRIRAGNFDAICHAAAVSDYEAAGIFAPDAGTRFEPETHTWSSASEQPPRLLDRAAGKVKSDEPELWLRLVRTPKLIDQFREPWGFRGTLVKFKLEVEKTEAELEVIGERSRVQSHADMMVANTLEGAGDWALVGPHEGRYQKVSRGQLAQVVVDLLEAAQASG